jgi:hypothetical protein
MANDYNGYIATYREYQRGDHYRKALTGWGPHSSDYMASRLVTMGGRLKEPAFPLPVDQEQEEILQPKTDADLALNDQRAQAFGQIGDTAIQGFERAAIQDDGGKAEAVTQPKDIRRFSTAFFTFNGGNNFMDNPRVRVERRVDGRWTEFADQSGEVQTTLKFPQGEEVASYLLGSYRWEWTAHFEAFISDFDTGERGRATPVGEYRFVVDGVRKQGGAQVPYHLESRVFRVDRWDGITVPDIAADAAGNVRLAVGPTKTLEVPRVKDPENPPPDCGTGDAAPCAGSSARASAEPTAAQAEPPIKVSECQSPKKVEGKVAAVIGPIDYPDSYKSPTPFINTERTVCRDPAAPNDASRFEWYCFQCSFRPRVDVARVSCAEATVVRRSGRVERIGARSADGRFVAPTALRHGEAAVVSRAGIRDTNGEQNGAPSAVVARGKPSAAVLRRARTLAGRELPCARPAQLPGRFTREREGNARAASPGGSRRVGSATGAAKAGDGSLPFTGLLLGALLVAALTLLGAGVLLRRLERERG